VSRSFLPLEPGLIFRANRKRADEDQAVIHDAEEGGYWAEVPAIPGCATQAETMEELLANLREAIEGCLSIDVAPPQPGGKERVLEIAV
jgi:predicted RNase H-like HicB family nuclease